MFDYFDAFSRNIGWITKDEQAILRDKRVAVAGLGGVGGEHLITLSRLGIQNFHISDFDDFEVHNFNRQAGAFMSTLNRPKCEVMAEVCKDINPQSNIVTFDSGIDKNNVDAFLDKVDIYVDSLDFFALEARKLVFQACQDKHIPIVTAAPIGMGTAFLCFMPGKMTFEQYFRFDTAKSETEQYLKFLIGLTPAMLHGSYLVDPSAANFGAKKGPSTPMGVKFCAGMAGTFVLKILLNRGPVKCAPWGLHFDGYRNKFKTTYRPFGNNNPIQKLVFAMAKKKLNIH